MKRAIQTKYKRLVVLLVVVLLLAAGGWFAWQNTLGGGGKKEPTAEEKALENSKDKSYDEMSGDELNARSKQETGRSFDELKSGAIGDDTFKNGEQASAAATVLSGTGEYDKSLEAYKQAERLIPEASRTVDFYQGYREAADQAGDIALGTELVKKELAIAERNGDKLQVEQLKLKITVREQEAGE